MTLNHGRGGHFEIDQRGYFFTVFWQLKGWRRRRIVWSVFLITISFLSIICSLFHDFVLLPFILKTVRSLHLWDPLFLRPGLCSQGWQLPIQLMEWNYILFHLWLLSWCSQRSALPLLGLVLQSQKSACLSQDEIQKCQGKVESGRRCTFHSFS